jgi:hypothetical protein
MDEQQTQQAQALGKRLALLLASMPLPDETKAGLAAMVPHMTLDQLQTFMGQLEKALPDGGDVALGRMAQGMKQAQDTYTQQHDEITQKTHAELDALESQLP